MPDNFDTFDDGLGSDPIDRGGGKRMGGGGGGGSDIDPSYEDALRIMGRAHEMPSPIQQRPMMMENAEAAELARRLTALRQATGAGLATFSAPPTLGASDEAASVGRTVQNFIAALQESPPEPQELEALRQQIGQAGDEIEAALGKVVEHPTVQAKLAGEEPPELDFPGL